jgi:hypothetical protein
MSPLAKAIYDLLRKRRRLPDPRVTYKELAARLRELSDEFEFITQRSQSLYAALCEVGDECRRLDLPCLPALVVRADTRRPGDAYFANSKETTRWERIAAWKGEVEDVRRASYPNSSDLRGN